MTRIYRTEPACTITICADGLSTFKLTKPREEANMNQVQNVIFIIQIEKGLMYERLYERTGQTTGSSCNIIVVGDVYLRNIENFA